MNLNWASTTASRTAGGLGQVVSVQTCFHAPTIRGPDSLFLLDPSSALDDANGKITASILGATDTDHQQFALLGTAIGISLLAATLSRLTSRIRYDLRKLPEVCGARKLPSVAWNDDDSFAIPRMV